MKSGTKAVARDLHTAVLVFRSHLLDADDGTSATLNKTRTNYELVFIHLRADESKERRSPEPKLHVFVTGKQGQELHYLEEPRMPSTADSCGLKGSIVFTGYAVAGQIPTTSATRRFSVQTRAGFNLAALDAYATEQKMKGDALDNLPAILDAIIDGEITTGKSK